MDGTWLDRFDGGFSMQHHERMEEVGRMVAEGQLHPRDIGVLWFLQGKMNYRTGRVSVRADALAEMAGISAMQVRASLSRLQKALVIARYQDKESGHRYYIINPYICSVGGRKTQAWLWKQFSSVHE